MSEQRIQSDVEQVIKCFSEKQRNGRFACPRCGCMRMNPESVTRNALSRRVSIYICDSCGMEEAIDDFIGNKVSLSEWAILKSPQLFHENCSEDN